MSRPALAGLLLIALAIRLAWGVSLSADPATLHALPDQVEYRELARSLIDAGELALFDSRFGETVRAYRMPGYPLFVALFGAELRLVRAAQAVLDTSTVLAATLLTRRWVIGPHAASAGWVAGAFVAFNPFLIYFSGLILSETLYAAMLAWGLVLLSRGGNGTFSVGFRRGFTRSSRGTRVSECDGRSPCLTPEPSASASPIALADARASSGRAPSNYGPYQAWLAGVALLALSAYVRPSGAGLAVVLGVISTGGVGNAALRGIVAAIVVVLVLTPWAVRNRVVLGESVWTTTNVGVTLYDGFRPDADGSSDQSFLAAMPELRAMGEVERSAYLVRLAGAQDRTPGERLALAGRKVARTWSPVPLSDAFGTPGRQAVAAAYAVPLFASAVVGLFSRRICRRGKALLLAPAVWVTVVHAISVGSLRYRVPADVPLVPLAAAGAVVVARSLSNRTDGRDTGRPSR